MYKSGFVTLALMMTVLKVDLIEHFIVRLYAIKVAIYNITCVVYIQKHLSDMMPQSLTSIICESSTYLYEAVIVFKMYNLAYDDIRNRKSQLIIFYEIVYIQRPLSVIRSSIKYVTPRRGNLRPHISSGDKRFRTF